MKPKGRTNAHLSVQSGADSARQPWIPGLPRSSILAETGATILILLSKNRFPPYPSARSSRYGVHS
jgi:hypothetical protein